MHFDWDDEKADINHRKHRFAFEDAMAIFLDPHQVILDTVRSQDGESRQKAIGKIGDRLFTAVFVMRGRACRLISARRSNVSEERNYGARYARPK